MSAVKPVSLSSNKPLDQPARGSLKVPQSTDFLNISTNNDIVNFNSMDRLLICAKLRTSIPCSSSWTVDDQSFDLLTRSLTPLYQNIVRGESVAIYLYLKSQMLSGGRSYTFYFRGAQLSASISVHTNSPPGGGALEVNPKIGFELTTAFEMSANDWTDLDLPLTFQFGYISINTNSKLILRMRSLESNSASVLPGGTSNVGYFLNCSVDIFDSLLASTSSITAVVVLPTVNFSLGKYVSHSINISTISIASSILNAVNCSQVPRCFLLNRQNCAFTDFTCGPCFEGFVGEAGDKNTPCFKSVPTSTSKFNNSRHCSFDEDCELLQSCNITSMRCFTPWKRCPNDCSSQGYCEFSNIYTGDSASRCPITAFDCQAKCHCKEGFAGSSCSSTVLALQTKTSQRQLLLSRVNNMTLNISSGDIVPLASTLCSIAMKSDELSSLAIFLTLDSAAHLIAGAAKYDRNYQDILCLLTTFDNIGSVLSMSNYSLEFNTVLSAFGSLISQQVVGGQSTIEFIQANFKMRAISPLSTIGNITESIPSTSLESMMMISQTQIFIPINSSTSQPLALSLVQSAANLEVNSAQMLLSNRLRLEFADWNVIGVSADSNEKEIMIRFPNIETLNNSNHINFTTICKKESFPVITNFTCPVSNKVITHNCTNRVGKMTSTCPFYEIVCSNVERNGDQTCRTVKYTNDWTVCACSFNRNNTAHRKLFDSTALRGTLEVIVVVGWKEVEGFSFEHSEFLQLLPFSILPKTPTVIFLLAGLWFGSIALVILARWSVSKKIEKYRVCPVRPRPESGTAAQEAILKYLNEIFPPVFRPDTSSRLTFYIEEMSRHHCYFSLARADLYPTFFIKLWPLLTFQSVLMLLLECLYSVQYSPDNGYCGRFTTESSCLSYRSLFDSSQTFCQWRTDGDNSGCSYQPKATSFLEAVLLAAIASIGASLIVRPFEFLFNILSAPTFDFSNVKDCYLQTGLLKYHEAGRSMAMKSSVEMCEIRRNRADQDHLIIPQSTIVIQCLARKWQDSLVDKASSMYRTDSLRIMIQKKRFQGKDCDYVESEIDAECDYVSNGEDLSKWRKKYNFHALFNMLCEDIKFQRQFLKQQELEEFDIEWMLDDFGEMKQDISIRLCKKYESWKEKLLSEIEVVQLVVRETLNKIEFSTEAEIGLQVLHLFVQDLLGTDTLAAKIFSSKAKIDFRRTKAFSKLTKGIVVGIILTLNSLLLYFIIAVGCLPMAAAWEMDFIVTFLAEILAEVFLCETLECIWMNCVLPTFVRKEVLIARALALDTAQLLLNKTGMGLNSTSNNEDQMSAILLNFPDYFFISTNIANAFPNLIESSIILAYKTFMRRPKELKQRSYALPCFTQPLLEQFNFFLNCWTLIPNLMQRILIRTFLPLMLIAVILSLLRVFK